MAHPRERVLGRALYYKEKGEQLPLDLLTELDKYGIMLSDFDIDPPTEINHMNDIGEPTYEQEETAIQNSNRHSKIPLVKRRESRRKI